MFRTKADRTIDAAHNAICLAEMQIIHAFTDDDKCAAYAALASAHYYLARATAARDAWNSTDHDEYEEYPNIRA